MERSKAYLGLSSLLVVLGIATFFLFYNNPELRQVSPSASSQQAALPAGDNGFFNRVSNNTGSQQQPVDVWRVWVEKQVELQTNAFLESVEKEKPYYLTSVESQVDEIKLELREAFERKAEEFKQGATEPPSIKVYDFSELDLSENQEETEPLKHEGPQTVQALLSSFEEMLVYPEIDAKYPQSEWVQMLLSRGIVIEDFADYSGYLSARHNLVHFENNPDFWQSGETGIPPTEDWETFKASFIDRHIWQYQHLKAAKAADPEVAGGFFVGPDHKTFLPFKPGQVYVGRFEKGAVLRGEPITDRQVFDLLYKGVHPQGYDIVYLDENDTVLSEAPPLITREELGLTEKIGQVEQNPSPLPRSPEAFPIDAYSIRPDDFAETSSDYSQPTDATVPTAHNQAEKRRADFIEKLKENETKLAKQLTSTLQALSTDDDIETAFFKQFEPERFDKAFATLQQYGLKEGMQRLRKTDPKVASEFERVFLSSQRPNVKRNTRP